MKLTYQELINLKKEELIGKVVCFPTDTVFGVGCLIDDEIGVKKIYNLKNRDFDKPLAVLVPSIEAVKNLVTNVPRNVNCLMNKCWPGALTIIFDKKEDKNTDACVAGNKTIGLRMPDSNIALKILEHFGPMATTSVNISGNPPLNDLNEIYNLFGDQIDYYVTDKQDKISKISSTVVRINNDNIEVLRQGSIKFMEELKISIGCDHSAVELKNEVVNHLKEKGYEVIDYGTNSHESCDYVDFAEKVASDVSCGLVKYGILICYTGIGMSMAANKFAGVRAALISNEEACKLTREHNDANILCFGAKDTTSHNAILYVDTFLNTEFSNGERHVRRVNKVKALDRR